MRTFVPNFPLQPRYTEYVIFNQVQNLATTLRNTLSTLFILNAFEHTSTAVALTATLSFLARDGAGMISTLLFSRFAPPFSLATDVKKWRYAADVTCDVALGLEFLTSYVLDLPQRAFILSLCLASCLKSVCGMMAGCAAGPIDFHWSGGDASNLPELSSKSAAQHTLSSGLGIVAGATLSRAAAGLAKEQRRSKFTLYAGWAALTVLHLAANARLLKTIALNSINRERLRIIMKNFLKDKEGAVLTPVEVAAKEPLIFWFGGGRNRKVAVGLPSSKGDDFGEDRVLIKGDKRGVEVLLREGVSALEGHYAAYAAQGGSQGGSQGGVQGGTSRFDEFAIKLEDAGWDVKDTSQLLDHGWRCRVE
ncbi:hypothetical protein TrRE_jg5549 [Triparma retinervis]|uniref:Protein root UVB sensitive/RUS domain-containing protein n=1 Tax=Triparma retinervis TaxID=2557542 RepID=A0A9W6ZWC6_9STRA|nr:hypothetical protein TrRE_jg5549 [Triparma retinervis]